MKSQKQSRIKMAKEAKLEKKKHTHLFVIDEAYFRQNKRYRGKCTCGMVTEMPELLAKNPERKDLFR